MTAAEAEDLRKVAHEVIIKLMDAGQSPALYLITEHAKSALAMVDARSTPGCQIGDGTAPPGWPSYSAVHGEPGRIECHFRGCGHQGNNGQPADMDCMGLDCSCSCCRFLAGAEVHGCTYGARWICERKH